MHNLSTVIRFEIIRTIKKKSFWIMALSFPLIIAGVIGIVFFSNKTTEDAAKATEKQKFTIAIKDDSNLINPNIVTALGIKTITDKPSGIALVQDGSVDAFFYYPTHPKDTPIEIYGREVGLFDNGRYSAVAKSLLEQSVAGSVNPDIRSALNDTIVYKSQIYKNGAVYDGFKQLIAPGIFLVLFYLLIAMFGNQMLSSTTEEKENRVIEIILTTIESRTLIIGKIISLIALAFIQAAVIVTPVVIAYIFLHDKLSLPSFDLSSLPFDPTRILVGFLLFASSFILFTGLLVTIGAASPTAKEAGGFLGIAMTLIFGPLYAAPLFVSSPDTLIVQVLSFFPFTAPIPLLLRNAVGNLTPFETIAALIMLGISSYIVLVIAIRVFRHGALEYSRRLSLKEIFRHQ